MGKCESCVHKAECDRVRGEILCVVEKALFNAALKTVAGSGDAVPEEAYAVVDEVLAKMVVSGAIRPAALTVPLRILRGPNGFVLKF